MAEPQLYIANHPLQVYQDLVPSENLVSSIEVHPVEADNPLVRQAQDNVFAAEASDQDAEEKDELLSREEQVACAEAAAVLLYALTADHKHGKRDRAKERGTRRQESPGGDPERE